MKHLSTYAILLLICLGLLAGCNNATNQSTEPTDNKTATDHTPITYQIYCDSPMNALPSNPSDQDIVFENSTVLDLDYSSSIDTVNKNAIENKQFTIRQDALQLRLKRSYSSSFAHSTRTDLRQYGNYDVYETTTDSERIEVTFRQNTDQLAFFLAYDRLTPNGNVTEQEARTCADALFTELYGQSTLMKYEHVITSVTKESTYMFTYYKTLLGYTTNDQIAIEVNKQGKIASVNAKRLGIFDPIASEITSKQIEAAEATLLNSISETYNVQHRQLFVDAISGKCYLQLIVSRPIDSGYQGNIFYINVN